MGSITDNTNRVRLLGISCILWSLSGYIGGAVDSFGVFCLMRIFLGVFQSGCNPPALSLIRDYFPPK
jgi:sugar phosphate permease